MTNDRLGICGKRDGEIQVRWFAPKDQVQSVAVDSEILAPGKAALSLIAQIYMQIAEAGRLTRTNPWQRNEHSNPLRYGRPMAWFGVEEGVEKKMVVVVPGWGLELGHRAVKRSMTTRKEGGEAPATRIAARADDGDGGGMATQIDKKKEVIAAGPDSTLTRLRGQD
ncbi:hypothetical protein CSUB01_04157 [Colletotrichum sublineola]|uniref:Uncharacterized protein n=1 Tax=Colletotrichum sublineola TaxID=1173701 RepID=A0A066WXE8_COLSU|nr:hypothetical protein CSUB01_04157 [Colletotrichum sublineola]